MLRSADQYFQVDGTLLISDSTTSKMNKFTWIRALRDVGIAIEI